MKAIFISLIVLVVNGLSQSLLSQTKYTLVDTINFSSTHFSGDMICMDYDSDGDMDLFNTFSRVFYKNMGNMNFVNQNSFYYTHELQFDYISDIDRDGDLDIAVRSGDGSKLVTFKYNQATLNYDTIRIQFPAMLKCIWYNLFNYSHNDLISSVFMGSGASGTGIYYNYYYHSYNPNNHSYELKDSNILVNIMNGLDFEMAAQELNIDINKDGYFDFITSQHKTIINNGIDSTNRFGIQNHIQSIQNIGDYNNHYDLGLALCHDFNNDGYVDKYLSYKYTPGQYGYNQSKYNFCFHRNQNGIFVGLISDLMPDSFLSSYAFSFDYNNDGILDLLQMSLDTNLTFYKGLGDFNFQMDTLSSQLPYSSIVTYSDFDNDGDIDIALVTQNPENTPGYFGPSCLAFYRNDSTPPNTPPTPPQTLWTTMDSTKIIFHWNPATDMETPQATWWALRPKASTLPHPWPIRLPVSEELWSWAMHNSIIFIYSIKAIFNWAIPFIGVFKRWIIVRDIRLLARKIEP